MGNSQQRRAWRKKHRTESNADSEGSGMPSVEDSGLPTVEEFIESKESVNTFKQEQVRTAFRRSYLTKIGLNGKLNS